MLSLITQRTWKVSFTFPKPQFSHLKTKGKVVLGNINRSCPAYRIELFDIIHKWKQSAKNYSNIQYYLDKNRHWERRICQNHCRWQWLSDSWKYNREWELFNSLFPVKRVILSQWVAHFQQFYHDSF